MKIAGLQKTTLIDYPGKIAAVIFTKGCNFRCSFCHNADLVNPSSKVKIISEKEVFDFLKKRREMLEGVVITGGEPTLRPDLINFIKKIKKLDFLVKLDTNGTNPMILKSLINTSTYPLINYIAMDIKGPLDKYQLITNSKINLENIKKSVEIIKNSGIDYEFRTTVVPTFLDKDDFIKIGKWLKGAKQYYLQQFRNKQTLDKKLLKVSPYTDKKLRQFTKIMKRYIKNAEIRGL